MAGRPSHIERVQSVIDYIEEHLRNELDIHEIAFRAGYSASHFQRLFQAIVGDTVAEYIRRRRLTEAFLVIARGQSRILDVALEYQFESQESFTRAFQNCFGVTPGECRKGRTQSLAANGKHRITAEYIGHLAKGIKMIPKMIDMAAFRVVGIEARFISILSPDKTNDVVIPRLWADFTQRSHLIKGRGGREELGLIYCLDNEPKSHPDECLYVCATKVSSIDEIPPGMISREVPGGKYAVFTHQGTADNFEHTMNYIYGSWFPKSGYEFDDRPEIEVYDGGIDSGETAGWDICIPVK